MANVQELKQRGFRLAWFAVMGCGAASALIVFAAILQNWFLVAVNVGLLVVLARLAVVNHQNAKRL